MFSKVVLDIITKEIRIAYKKNNRLIVLQSLNILLSLLSFIASIVS
jgi:hypothetical protein